MEESPLQKLKPKRDWALSPDAFSRLLHWLDGGVDSAGRGYLEMRRRLVAYFDRKNCPTPDDLADQTLNRVARRLEEEGALEAEVPARYCYIVARFVFMEHLRGTEKFAALPRNDGRPPAAESPAPEADDEAVLEETMMDCLERCLGRLEARSRDLIIRYYAGRERAKIENRRALAEELGITANALSIRACRIRDRLEKCVRECVGAR